MFVPAVSCLMSVLSVVSTLTLEIRSFLCGLFTVVLACVWAYLSVLPPFVVDKAATIIGSSSCVCVCSHLLSS